MSATTGAGLLALVALALGAQSAAGQELEARAYAPNPVGARFAVMSWSHSDGDMLLNDSAPIKDFEVRANSLAAGIGGTFALWDRLASAALGAPYVDTTATGLLYGVPARADRTGVADLRLRLTLSLLPGSAQSLADFTRSPPDRTLGVSLVVSAPTGEYFEDKLVNIGTNRWAVRPEFGGSRRFGRWNFDGSLGVWLFGDNDAYLGRKERSQDPLTTLQGHVSYTFAPRLWLGLSGTWYTGGTTFVDGVSDRNRQANSRAGLTLAIPVGKRNSVKLAWSKGVTARFGGDLETYSLSWQYLWFR
jgi:Putative MetA-pathway of phenol degradation